MAKNNDWLSRVESRWSLLQAIGGFPVIGGLVGGVVAAFTNFMSAWAPFSWFVGAIFGAIGFQAWALLRTWQGERAAKKSRLEMLEPPKGYVSLASERFEGQRIYLPDMILPGTSRIEGKEFIGCELIGPVNVIIIATRPGLGSIRFCTFSACDGVAFNRDANISNVIILQDCILKNCRLHYWTVLFSEDDRDFIADNFAGLNIIN